MQRWSTKLRFLAVQSLIHPPFTPLSGNLGVLHSSRQQLHCPRAFSAIASHFRPFFNASLMAPMTYHGFWAPPFPVSLVQIRHISTKDKKRKKARERKPMTPATSKMKKIKMKSYSSYKSRFRTMNDGKIRRWKEGKQHNAHLKSKKSKRRLRRPGIVPVAYAKVMKKLNFCA